MSAEGKKKRGISGASNAKSIAFRYGGKPSNYSTVIGNPLSTYGAGSRLVVAVLFGSKLPGFNPSERLAVMVDNAIDHRVTSKFLKY